VLPDRGSRAEGRGAAWSGSLILAPGSGKGSAPAATAGVRTPQVVAAVTGAAQGMNEGAQHEHLGGSRSAGGIS
jgi:hypothetical protein